MEVRLDLLAIPAPYHTTPHASVLRYTFDSKDDEDFHLQMNNVLASLYLKGTVRRMLRRFIRLKRQQEKGKPAVSHVKV